MREIADRLTALRGLIRPLAEYALWPVYFASARAIREEAFYLVALVLLLAADVMESPGKSRALGRDLAAGALTALFAAALNDQLGLIVGATIAGCAMARLSLRLPLGAAETVRTTEGGIPSLNSDLSNGPSEFD